MNADSQNTDYYILSLGSDYEIEIVVNKIKYITDNQKKNTFLLRAFSRTFTQLFLILVSELSLGSDYDIEIVVNKIKYITDNQKKYISSTCVFSNFHAVFWIFLILVSEFQAQSLLSDVCASRSPGSRLQAVGTST